MIATNNKIPCKLSTWRALLCVIYSAEMLVLPRLRTLLIFDEVTRRLGEDAFVETAFTPIRLRYKKRYFMTHLFS